MNKRQIEVEKAKLAAEKKELLHLKAIYNKAAQDIAKKLEISNGKINVLLKDFDSLDEVQKSILQSQIYQRNFQLSLKKQIDGFLKDLNTDQYESIDQYMKDCYETGFLGSMYDLNGQGIPIVTPIDQKQIAEAVKINSKISKKLYKKLGEDVDFLKKRIANNIARGIATASEYKVIARNIAADSNMGFNRAMRIARTEGHGMQCQAAEAAQHAAKKAGADVLKQWDAALDKRTRASHARVDGEIRELDEKFSNGMMRPADPNGGAAEVVNCRCALLQRARWALDEDELQTLKDRAAYYGLDKTKNFDDFRKKYLKTVDAEATKDYNEIKIGELYIYGKKHSKNIQEFIKDAPENVRAVWNDCANDFHVLNPKYNGKKAYYSPSEDGVLLNISAAAKGNGYQTPYQVVFHEYGHHIDYIFNQKYGTGERFKAFSETYKNGILGKTAKKEAEESIEKYFVSNVKKYLPDIKASDIRHIDDADDVIRELSHKYRRGEITLDEVLKNEKVRKGFVRAQKTQVYKEFCEDVKANTDLIDRTDISDMFEPIMPKDLHHPFGVGHGSSYWNNRDNGKEVFAEIYSALVNNKGSLEQIKKYFPKTYKIFIEMMGVIKK